MSKKNKHIQQRNQPVVSERLAAVVSRRGRRTIYLGIGAVITGFAVLSFADPAGQNFAASLSPFIIIGGYAVIGVGIILPAGKSENPPAARADVTRQSPEREKPASK
ncbi:MAG: hypothetical protein QME32_00855 [Endomicrobiia bacterium]|nr:hypothetical protein [Endomicrobiia bacterium]